MLQPKNSKNLTVFITIFVLVFFGLSLTVLGLNYFFLFGLGTVSWNNLRYNLFGLLFNYFFGLSYFLFCFSFTIFGLLNYFFFGLSLTIFGLGTVGWNNLFGFLFNNFLRSLSDNLFLGGFGTVKKEGNNL